MSVPFVVLGTALVLCLCAARPAGACSPPGAACELPPAAAAAAGVCAAVGAPAWAGVELPDNQCNAPAAARARGRLRCVPASAMCGGGMGDVGAACVDDAGFAGTCGVVCESAPSPGVFAVPRFTCPFPAGAASGEIAAALCSRSRVFETADACVAQVGEQCEPADVACAAGVAQYVAVPGPAPDGGFPLLLRVACVADDLPCADDSGEEDQVCVKDGGVVGLCQADKCVAKSDLCTEGELCSARDSLGQFLGGVCTANAECFLPPGFRCTPLSSAGDPCPGGRCSVPSATWTTESGTAACDTSAPSTPEAPPVPKPPASDIIVVRIHQETEDSGCCEVLASSDGMHTSAIRGDTPLPALLPMLEMQVTDVAADAVLFSRAKEVLGDGDHQMMAFMERCAVLSRWPAVTVNGVVQSYSVLVWRLSDPVPCNADCDIMLVWRRSVSSGQAPFALFRVDEKLPGTVAGGYGFTPNFAACSATAPKAWGEITTECFSGSPGIEFNTKSASGSLPTSAPRSTPLPQSSSPLQSSPLPKTAPSPPNQETPTYYNPWCDSVKGSRSGYPCDWIDPDGRKQEGQCYVDKRAVSRCEQSGREFDDCVDALWTCATHSEGGDWACGSRRKSGEKCVSFFGFHGTCADEPITKGAYADIDPRCVVDEMPCRQSGETCFCGGELFLCDSQERCGECTFAPGVLVVRDAKGASSGYRATRAVRMPILVDENTAVAVSCSVLVAVLLFFGIAVLS